MIIRRCGWGFPILVSRSGFTAWGVDLARQVGLTLVVRARGKRFIALSARSASSTIRIWLSSKKNPRATSARAVTVTTEFPATPGVLLAAVWRDAWAAATSRMREISGRTILERVIARLKPQCDGLILNANGDPARFAAFGLPVIADTVEIFRGHSRYFGSPRLGRGEPARRVVDPQRRGGLSVSTARPRGAPASRARRTERAACGRRLRRPVAPGDRIVERRVARGAAHALVVEDIRKIDRWTARYPLATVTWPVDELDPFFNAPIHAASRPAVAMSSMVWR